MLRTLRSALRALARTPGFTAVVVLCLALGIGLNVAFMGVLDVLLLRPPAGVREPAALYRVEPRHEPLPGQRVFFGQQLSRGDVARLAARREVFARVAGFSSVGGLSLGSGPEAREVSGAIVDGDYFAATGASARLGRLIGPADTLPGAPRAVVLSEPLWQAAFGGDAGVVGREVRINGEALTVVGIAGGGFTGVETNAMDLWVSPSAAVLSGWRQDMVDSPETRWLFIVARLAPGATPERATAVATTVLRAAPRPPDLHSGDDLPRTAQLTPVTTRFGATRGDAPVPPWLLAATAAVLLVACANVANLLLARGEARRRELATRTALGATRAALVRQLMAESALLAGLGGALGLAIAHWGARAFALVPGMPPLGDVVGGRTALATVGVAALTALLCGLVPALRGTRVDAAMALRAGARVRGRRSRLRGALMAGQLAATLALLVTAGAFARSLRALHRVDLGFDLERVVAVSVNLGRSAVPEGAREALALRALERVRALPGVTHAARSFGAPLTATLTVDEVSVDGATLPSPMGGKFQFVVGAGEGYFQAMGQRLVRGRGFTAADERAGDAGPVIVSEAFARAAWGAADPIGKCVRQRERACVPVVGVAADAAYMSIRDTALLTVYQPVSAEGAPPFVNLVVRARGDARAVAREVRAVLQGLDPRMPYVSAFALGDGPGIESQLAPYRLAAAAFSLFGGLALLVAAIGLYAVVAYAVARRTGEIGVRVALGATAAHVRRLVLGEGARHVLLGGAVGLLLGAWASWALRARLYGVAAFDPATYVLAAAVLGGAALLASWLPARRASRIPPTEALRAE